MLRADAASECLRKGSCVSDSGLSARPRSSSQAFIIRQKSTGEEIVVTMKRVASPINPRTVVSRVPTYLASGRFVPAASSGRVADDSICDYRSLGKKGRRPAKRLALSSVEAQKRMLLDEARQQRLEGWQREHRRRQRSMTAELAALKARTPSLVLRDGVTEELLVPENVLVPELAPELVPQCLTEPEKERRRMAGIVSCVGVAITGLAAALVALSLGLSHLLEEPRNGWSVGQGRRTLNASLFLSGLGLNNSSEDVDP